MSTAALELSGIVKHYGAVQANQDVSLRVERGTIHALVGENGAGKSTLMKIAYGYVRADAGEISIKGEAVSPHSVPQSLARGVGMVHQHFMLVKPLTVAENVVLGREPTRFGGLIDLARAEREITELSRRFGLEVDPHARVEDLSVGQQQRVEILKVLWQGCDVLILDEPTAVLTPGEVRELFDVLRGLVAEGMTIVLITHKLDEVLAVAHRVTVMRRGEVVGEMDSKGLRADDIARAMVGRPVLLRVDKGPAPVDQSAAPVLDVGDLQVTGARGLPALRGVSLQVRAGEIVGIAGVEGNGQSELIEALVGLRSIDGGSIHLRGQDITGKSVYQRYESGMAHVPEDRHDRALVLDFSVRQNLILGQQKTFASRAGILAQERIDDYAKKLVDEFEVRPPEPDALVATLSGGNQQKVVIARELSRQEPALLICAQPTRGVDIGAIEAIHRRMVAARDDGLAVLLLSADLSELRGLSDRLLVMYKGRIVAELNATDLEAEDALERVGAFMTGAAARASTESDAPSPSTPEPSEPDQSER